MGIGLCWAGGVRFLCCNSMEPFLPFPSMASRIIGERSSIIGLQGLGGVAVEAVLQGSDFWPVVDYGLEKGPRGGFFAALG